jgi:hypothetical protein
MNSISLTDFVDIVSSAGTPKATKVREVREREEYHPMRDYYKGMRERIIDAHRNNLSKKSIKVSAFDVAAHKQHNYSVIANAYHGWWGNKNIEWFAPPFTNFESSGVSIRINPEIGLYINSAPHLVKLYFKKEKITKNRIDIITHLLAHCFQENNEHDAAMCVLDIRRKKLFTGSLSPELHPMVVAELAYIAALLD